MLSCHIFVKFSYLVLYFYWSVNCLYRFGYPSWKMIIKLWLLVSFVKEEYHPIVFCMPNYSSQSLIDTSHRSHKIPFLSLQNILLIYCLSRYIIKMIFLLYYVWISYICIWNTDNYHSSTQSIRKINPFTKFSSANETQNSTFS